MGLKSITHVSMLLRLDYSLRMSLTNGCYNVSHIMTQGCIVCFNLLKTISFTPTTHIPCHVCVYMHARAWSCTHACTHTHAWSCTHKHRVTYILRITHCGIRLPPGMDLGFCEGWASSSTVSLKQGVVPRSYRLLGFCTAIIYDLKHI